jgi:hypothetical protein
MKTCVASFAFALACACCFAGEESVLVNAPEPTTVVAAAPATACTACAQGTCCAESSSRSTCRPGLFGRTIERTRTVTRAVVEVPVKVVTAPARAVRVRRGCCAAGCCQ